MIRTLRLALFAAVVALAACGSGSSSGGTFACGSTLTCTAGTQYCLHNDGSGNYSCVNLPAGCSAQAACDGCIGTIANQTACVAIGSVVDVNVSM